MDGRAADAYAVLERLALRIQPRERRQQRRVDVQDPARESRQQRRTDESHESRQAHESDVACAELTEEGLVVRVATAVCARIEMKRLDTGLAIATETRRVHAIHDD